MAHFQPNFAQSILGWRGFKFVQMKGPAFSKGRQLRNSQNTLTKLKNPLLQNHWANFSQTCHNVLGEGDSSLYKRRPPPFPRRNNYKIVKIHWWNLKKSSSPEPLSQFQQILAQSIPCVRGIQVSSNDKTINFHKVNNVIFSSLNQCYDIIICVYWFELFSQVSDVVHGPLVVGSDLLCTKWSLGIVLQCHQKSEKNCPTKRRMPRPKRRRTTNLRFLQSTGPMIGHPTR